VQLPSFLTNQTRKPKGKRFNINHEEDGKDKYYNKGEYSFYHFIVLGISPYPLDSENIYRHRGSHEPHLQCEDKD